MIGTGLNGVGMAKGARTQMTAVITPTRASCFVVINDDLEDVCSMVYVPSLFPYLQESEA